MSSTFIFQVISYYHDLLLNGHWQSTAEILQSNSAQLSVAGRPVCTVLRPFFLDEQTYTLVRTASEAILKAIHQIGRRLHEDAGYRSQLDLSAEEEKIIRIDPGYGLPDASARLDGFLDATGNFRFVEYNADSPGGIGYGDALAEVFSRMPVFTEFGKTYSFRAIPVRSIVTETLNNAYRKWGGKAVPNIAIVDWADAPTYNEFLIFQEYLQRNRHRVRIVSPEQLEIRDGKLYAGDFRVDLIYKRLLVGELLSRLGTQGPLVEAVRRRLVCMVNGFGVQMLFKKIIFALLSESVHSDWFDVRTCSFIETHIPWTRKVREERTSFHGREIELIPWIGDHRQNFVLKPNGEYGGKGVILGWETGQSQWESAVDDALQKSYVVQERVSVGSESYPALVDGKLQFADRFFDLDPYVWNGVRSEGCGVRLSQLSLMNVSAGGGSAVPLFIIRQSG